MATVTKKGKNFDDKNFGNNFEDSLTDEANNEESQFQNSGDELFNSEYQEGMTGDLNLANDTIYNLQDLDQHARKEPHTTTVRYNGKDYPIVISQTVQYLAKHLLSHNAINGYSLVTLIGKSGSGKSTFTQSLGHYVHVIAQKQFNSTYAVNWFRKKEIESLDKIIASMEKGINRIIIFEDASYVFNDKKESEIEEVMAKLTYVRHTLQARIIIMVQIHYSKALEKFLRDGDLKILTSISDEEVDNYLRLFGWSAKFMVNLFARKFRSMNVEGYYYSNAGPTKVYKYYTKEPFKIALVSDFGSRSFTNYHKISCQYCEPNFDASQVKSALESMTMKDFFVDMKKKYSETRRIMSVLKNHIYYNSGIDLLATRERAVTRNIVQYFHDHPDDYKTLVGNINSGKTLEQVFREFGLIEKNVSREETRKQRRLEKKKSRELRQALKNKSKEQKVLDGATVIDTDAVAKAVSLDTVATEGTVKLEDTDQGDRSGLANDPLAQQDFISGKNTEGLMDAEAESANDSLLEDTADTIDAVSTGDGELAEDGEIV